MTWIYWGFSAQCIWNKGWRCWKAKDVTNFGLLVQTQHWPCWTWDNVSDNLGMTVWYFLKISWFNPIFSYFEKIKYTWFLELALYLKASCSSWVYIPFLGFIYWHGLGPYLSTFASCSSLEPLSATCLFKSLASNSPMRKLLIKLYYRRTSVLWVEK